MYLRPFVLGAVVTFSVVGVSNKLPASAAFPAQASFSSVDTVAVGTLRRMLDAIDSAEGLQYTMKAWERIEGRIVYTEQDVRLAHDPFRIHMRMRVPHDGVEVLFVEGERKGLALVKPAGFPYINVKLSPDGWRMREDQHHTVRESGYRYFAAVTQAGWRRFPASAEGQLMLEKEHVVDGQACWKLTVQYPDYRWESYRLQAGENVLSVAKARHIPEHAIVERNAFIGNPDDGKTGQSILIPTTYSAKVELYIDTNKLLPIKQLVYDDLGLYEHYEFANLMVNPVFHEREFESACPQYGF